MFDANGNALLSPGEWLAVYSVIVGTALILAVAVVATLIPKHWG
jgi:hypothetical protein